MNALIEKVADRIQERMGPLFGSPEFLADPVKRARAEKRQRDSALSFAQIAVEEATLAAAIPPEQDGYAEGRAREVLDRQLNRRLEGSGRQDGRAYDSASKVFVGDAIAAMLAFATDRHAEGRIAGLVEALQPLADVYITGAEDDDDEDALDVDFPKVRHVRAARKALRTLANGGPAA
jgi:hypothetical protein